MEKEVFENHKKYLERIKLFKDYDYDIDKEREFVLEQAKPISGKILEAGTGKGHFAIALAKQGYSFTAFDISQEELNFAKLNLAYLELNKNVDLRVENAEHTSFADKSFDTIFSINTLHHFQNPYKIIDEFIRLLSQKGKLVLGDFTNEGFAVIDKIHASEGNTHSQGNANLSDAQEYLKRKSFSIKRARTLHQDVLVAEKGNV